MTCLRRVPRLPRIARRSLLTAALAVAALGGAQAQTNDPKVLTIGNPFSPLSMDPSLSGNGRAGTHLMPCYEPLIRVKADGSFEPALATAWTISADSKEATFTIRTGAKFSDGEPVTAEAVKKSIEYFRSKKGPFSVNLASVTAIDVVEGNKVRIRVGTPNPALINLFEAYWLAGDIISPKGLEKPDLLGTQSFGAGPYRLDTATTVTGKVYNYVPNEHYYDKSRIKWARVQMIVYEDQNSAIQAMKAGQVKFLVSDPVTGHANAGKLDKNIRTITDPVQWIGLIIMDRDGALNPALKDVRVRQAINLAIDRKVIAKALLGDFADPTVQIQGRGFMGYDAGNEAKYPYDPAKARQLLAAAGYPNGFEMKLAYVNNTLSSVMSQVLAGQFRKVGISAKLNELQNFGALNAARDARAFDVLMFNTNSGVPNLAKFQTLDPKGSLNMYGSQDATLTRLIAEASDLPLVKAEAAWKKVYAQVTDLAWFAPIAATHVVYFATDAVKAPKPGASVVIDMVNVVPAK